MKPEDIRVGRTYRMERGKNKQVLSIHGKLVRVTTGKTRSGLQAQPESWHLDVFAKKAVEQVEGNTP